ncbi:hypothetical protein M440DRAFT_324515 [Trichoderma longibrachiatum ATCC 18648]|uniref:Uncharacterized protein n=1 Tax=Trichoderma longibrachiatum ATCC 18648 TaxID=983965 RepID=A0A2T4C1T6_TRILO|nr:hypothetical protein M440DRAFT_324515 [Trichoderma longibrachiatum ATCC 18648]
MPSCSASSLWRLKPRAAPGGWFSPTADCPKGGGETCSGDWDLTSAACRYVQKIPWHVVWGQSSVGGQAPHRRDLIACFHYPDLGAAQRREEADDFGGKAESQYYRYHGARHGAKAALEDEPLAPQRQGYRRALRSLVLPAALHESASWMALSTSLQRRLTPLFWIKSLMLGSLSCRAAALASREGVLIMGSLPPPWMSVGRAPWQRAAALRSGATSHCLVSSDLVFVVAHNIVCHCPLSIFHSQTSGRV